MSQSTVTRPERSVSVRDLTDAEQYPVWKILAIA